MTDNLQKYALFAEIASAFAIVISLIFVGFQIQQSNHLARAEAFRTPVSNLNALNASFIAIPEYRSGWQKVVEGEGTESMSPEEIATVSAYLVSIMNIYDQISREIHEGILEPEAMKDFAGRGIIRSRFFRQNWPVWQRDLSPRFVAEFEQLVDLDLSPDPQAEPNAQ